MSEPTPSRPHMPDYGIPDSTEGQLSWPWAEERFGSSHNYWVATTRPDGRPHVMPVWGVWLDGAFYFSTGADSRKARNLAANANCVVCTEGAEEAVIVEGVAAPVTDAAVLQRFAETYGPKYNWEVDTSEGGFYVVRPRVAFAFIERQDEFAKSATRWTWSS